MTKYRPMARVMVARPDGKVLVLRRSPDDEHNPGRVDFPGGRVESGEAYLAAAVRETEEEVGLRIAASSFTLAYTFTTYDQAEQEVVPRFLYVARVDKDAAVHLSHEHDAYWWRTPAEAAQLFSGTSWKEAVSFVLQHELAG